MKAFFLIFALLFVAAQAFPRKGETSPTIQNLIVAASTQSNESYIGTPEYDEVFKSFYSTISYVQTNINLLRQDGHIILESSESGKPHHDEFDRIVSQHLTETTNSLYKVLSSLPSGSSFRWVLIKSKAAWVEAREKRGEANSKIVDFVRANARDLMMEFNKVIRLDYIGFNEGVGSMLWIIEKYFSDN